MNFEGQKTPQEMAQIKKERAISDAELLKGGAEYKIDSKENEVLSVTNEQVGEARKEMDNDMWPYNVEAPKTLNEQRDEFIDEQLKDAQKLIDMQIFSSEEQKTAAVEKLKSAAGNLFDSWATNIKAGLTPDDVKFLDEAENPYNYMGMSAEEKMRLYDLQERKQTAKEQVEREKSEGATQGTEKEKDLGKSEIEKKIENMTDDERKLYDSQITYANLLEENRVLLNEGKINQEQFKSIMKNIQDLNMPNIKALKEKVGSKKSDEILDLSFNQRNAKISEMMKKAGSFDDLYKAVRRNYEIKFSDGTAEEPNYFVDIIEKVRSGQLDINYVTRTGGLRSKVEKLMKGMPQKSDNSKNEEDNTAKIENREKSKDELEGYYKQEFGEKGEEIGEKIRQISDEILNDSKIQDIFNTEYPSHAVVRPSEEANSDVERTKIKGRLVEFFKRYASKDDFVKDKNETEKQLLKEFPSREKDLRPCGKNSL